MTQYQPNIPRARLITRTDDRPQARLDHEEVSDDSELEDHVGESDLEDDEDRSLILQEDVVKGAVQYSLDVTPLSVVLMLLHLGTLLLWTSPIIQSTLAPACVPPSSLRFPTFTWTPQTPPNFRTKWADYPRLIEAETKTFDQLMDEFVAGNALSLQVKRAEMATKDLLLLVRISDLKAKDILASLLSEFVHDAKKTSRGLQKLSSKVGGTVDDIMTMNAYALRSIEDTRANEPTRFMQAIAFWRKPADAIVAETFEDATNILSRNLERLILEAEVNVKNLDDLEKRLDSLHELILREDHSISTKKEDVLAELWTKLGANKKKLRNFDSHLKLLKEFRNYTGAASNHVDAAMETLLEMSEDMEDIRERAAAPNLVGMAVPVEVHMRSIEMGLQRLKEGRMRAKRLEEDAMDQVIFLAD